MKKLIFFLLIMILGKFTYAVVNVHQPGSPQWHAQNQMLWGQLEHDRRMEEQRAAQRAAQQVPTPPPIDESWDGGWSAFVWHEETGDAYYISNEWIKKGAQRALVKKAKKHFVELYNMKPTNHLVWDGGWAIITMGIDRKTGKITAFYDNDMIGWGLKYGEDENLKEKVLRDALDNCEAKAYNCEIMYSFE